MERASGLTGDVEQTIGRLRREHAELDERLHLLERKAWLSTEEEAEVHRLKKLKLAKKDKIETLSANTKSAGNA